MGVERIRCTCIDISSTVPAAAKHTKKAMTPAPERTDLCPADSETEPPAVIRRLMDSNGAALAKACRPSRPSALSPIVNTRGSSDIAPSFTPSAGTLSIQRSEKAATGSAIAVAAGISHAC